MENDGTLARFARRLRIWTMIFTAGVLLAMVLGVAFPSNRFVIVQTPGLPRFWGMWLAVLAVALVVLAMIELVRMLRQVERGEIFAPAATRHFRGFARFLLWSALVRVALAPIVSFLAIIAGKQAGPILGLDDRNLMILLLAALFFLIARLFDQAARLDEDSRSIV